MIELHSNQVPSMLPRHSWKVIQPDIISYREALKLQSRAGVECTTGRLPGVLIMLQHHPVITMGRSAVTEGIVFSLEELNRRRIEIVTTIEVVGPLFTVLVSLWFIQLLTWLGTRLSIMFVNWKKWSSLPWPIMVLPGYADSAFRGFG